MQASVVIPTRGRPRKLAACLGALARQSTEPGSFEVLVGFDGPDPAGEAAAIAAWREAAGHSGALRIEHCPPEGYNAARNRLLERCRGRVLISMNDDVVANPSFVETHIREQQAAERNGRPAIITGYSPWRRYADETLFDRLVRETSLIFFYDRMFAPGCEGAPAEAPDHDWGFRHCWGLNFSCPMASVKAVGGFTAIPRTYGYDDIELAWRLRNRSGMPVLFRPAARAEHDHRYAPAEVLDRERRLGAAAWRFAAVNPAFGRDVFRRDIRSAESLEETQEFVDREAGAVRALEPSFLALGSMPASGGVGARREETVEALHTKYRPLKRWVWSSALLEASRVEAAADERQPMGASA